MPISLLVKEEGAWRVRVDGAMIRSARQDRHWALMLLGVLQPKLLDGTEEEPTPVDVEQLAEWVAYRVIGEASA